MQKCHIPVVGASDMCTEFDGRDVGFRFSYPEMDDLIKLVRTYRLTTGLAERIRLAEEIFRLIQPDLRFFVFSSISHHAAEDVCHKGVKL